MCETAELVLNKRRLVPLSKASEGASEGVTDRGSCASQCKGPKSSSATQDATWWQDKEARMDAETQMKQT